MNANLLGGRLAASCPGLLVAILAACLPLSLPAADMAALLATGLPLLDISTVGGDEPTCDYVVHPEGCDGYGIANAVKVPGRLLMLQGPDTLYDSGPYGDGGGMTVRLRGNTSAWQPKKPYKLKLCRAADLVRPGGALADTEWLLVNAVQWDLKTHAGLLVSRLVGMPWTPRCRCVNVVMNGLYRGVYLLVESVKRHPGVRIGVADDGFLFERDAYWWNEPFYFSTAMTAPLPNYQYTLKYPSPDDVSESDVDYLRGVLDAFEASVFAGGYSRLFNVGSLSRWLLGHDILGTFDGQGSNIFIAKNDRSPSSLLYMACLWDFDTAFMTPGRWATIHRDRYFPWPSISPDSSFHRAYVGQWLRVRGSVLEGVADALDSLVASPEGRGLALSRQHDSALWGVPYRSPEEDAAAVRSWLAERVEWLDSAILGTGAGVRTMTVPRRTDGAVYDLQGRRVGGTCGTLRPGVYIRNGRKFVAP